jgi:hypothetical protein
MERVALALIDGKISQVPETDTIRGAGAGSSGYQKYYVASTETYTIPTSVSSVITGPFMNDGVLIVEGRLEVL